MNAVCEHLFSGKTLSEDELVTHIDVIQKLYYNYSDAIETLNTIQAKINWHFKASK